MLGRNDLKTKLLFTEKESSLQACNYCIRCGQLVLIVREVRFNNFLRASKLQQVKFLDLL